MGLIACRTPHSIGAMSGIESLRFDHSFARLPEGFQARIRPTPLSGTQLVSISAPAAGELGLPVTALRSESARAFLSGAELHPDSDPVVMCHAGHQFGHYVPQLGDGRAINLGEVLGEGGARSELQLRGAGLTPFSRDGDGRAVLRSTTRECLCSEDMHGLGIPTARAVHVRHRRRGRSQTRSTHGICCGTTWRSRRSRPRRRATTARSSSCSRCCRAPSRNSRACRPMRSSRRIGGGITRSAVLPDSWSNPAVEKILSSR